MTLSDVNWDDLLDYAQERKAEAKSQRDNFTMNYWRGYIACLLSLREQVDPDDEGFVDAEEGCPW